MVVAAYVSTVVVSVQVDVLFFCYVVIGVVMLFFFLREHLLLYFRETKESVMHWQTRINLFAQLQ